MRIVDYEFAEGDEQSWTFSRTHFGRVNLLVGDSATGKSRLLNTIFNLGKFVARSEFKSGSWDIAFEHQNSHYSWRIKSENSTGRRAESVIVSETLMKETESGPVVLVERDGARLIYNGVTTPKLSPSQNSLDLLREEALIKPLFEGFSTIKRRLFQESGLASATTYAAIPTMVANVVSESKSLRTLFDADLGIGATLHLLNQNFRKVYRHIVDSYKAVFPFVEEVRITDWSKLEPRVAVAGHVPVVTIRERGSGEWVQLNDVSSGMQKVLIILTDLLTMPEGGVYLIDEYENSLGLSAISFLPEFLLGLDRDIQLFITSHHPYLINAIPTKDWFVFHRTGKHVNIVHGPELEERFGNSKQQAFTKLINDPLYVRGVE